MDRRRLAELVAAAVGLLGLLAVLPLYAASGLAAPLWAVAVLLAFWLLLFTTAIVRFRRSPWLILVMPLMAAAVWWVAITVGEQVLGWQA